MLCYIICLFIALYLLVHQVFLLDTCNLFAFFRKNVSNFFNLTNLAIQLPNRKLKSILSFYILFTDIEFTQRNTKLLFQQFTVQHIQIFLQIQNYISSKLVLQRFTIQFHILSTARFFCSFITCGHQKCVTTSAVHKFLDS